MFPPNNFIFNALKILKILMILESYGYSKSVNSSMSQVWQILIQCYELVTRNILDISMQYLKSLMCITMTFSLFSNNYCNH